MIEAILIGGGLAVLFIAFACWLGFGQ